MFLLDGTVVYSASDLTAAAACEWALMRRLDAKLGRIDAVVEAEDDMLRRTATLGDLHELATLEQLRETGGVVEIARPSIDQVAVAAEQTLDALRSGAAVVFQGAFFDGRFLGYSDFLVRDDNGEGGAPAYSVYDTKLARKAKITALLQLAAYADQLQQNGIPTSETVHLILGTGKTTSHRLRDILPVYRRRRARLQQLVDDRVADSEATQWGDPRYTACGRCAACAEQVERTRDVLLVAGMRLTQRARLRAAGIQSIDQLAVATGPVAGLAQSTLESLAGQARMQLEPPASGQALSWQIADPAPLAAIPAPDAGDIFFDFEGDPLYQEGSAWGLDYLFGLVEPDETFVAFWAHDLAQERQALIDFLDYVAERRARHPLMHIYHYASYERTHLLTLAARHGVGEDAVDDLLRQNVLVDLYPIVRQGMRIGTHSYSLKKLEPLYMGDAERAGVANAADSITEYVRSRELLAAGDAAGSARVQDDIARYNTYDCVSTLRLRDWLLERAASVPRDSLPTGLIPQGGGRLDFDLPVREPDPVYLELAALSAAVPLAERTADDTALALASAAIDYHRREQKSFWWQHFARLTGPIDEWADTRDVLVVTDAVVLRDWFREGRQRSDRRRLGLRGILAPGSSIKPGQNPFILYDAPYPPILRGREPGARTAHSRVTVVENLDDGTIVVDEVLEKDAPHYDELPVALTPGTPPPPGTQVDAINEWGRAILDAHPEPLVDPAYDVLRRRPPRATLAPVTVGADGVGDVASALVDSLLTLDHSYLAVQGPPGTGKTYTGSHVIARLVHEHGWRIGVVAQSHAAVENMLRAVVGAGVDRGLVGKKASAAASAGDDEPAFTVLSPTDFARFTSRDGGFVVGGTAWDFSNASRIPRQSLDLLVVDEAGQFSLASTIASSVAATRLLLLGDPQQLPQVSQGTHPEPVDESALGWLSAGHDVLPPELGYFLATSWRMHPAVCAPVSELSYEGRLVSHASDRRLQGVEPGLHPVPIDHAERSTSSPEEADAVVEIVASVLGRTWSSGGASRPLGETDIIVVAPYNAQVELLRLRLSAAGYESIPAGTVDKFQGREAAVAIVSLAASSADDVPRGLEFLLLANRLNVAISRAQWAAYLVYSPALTDALPRSEEALAQLSAFIRLVS
ncbi:TM0106 family RecB-like putative nuclease [Agreia sp. PsM10]|uniref:TM0106 family RecB-like putative nuclease n=1 Tax=Agreia sp. PsM10 TaxID=3030533 RepID=UPI00263B6D89|nr:bifunctional RecB family nuclease/DEAD/DEAH box helicase [Agreia sp. PsM10]MDN4642048.1 TM0106 family RecB-like putative nuclease [Agreia sp. PsM10]